MRERRLLVLASKPRGVSPSQRYRLEQWEPHLAANFGISLEFAPFESQALVDLLYRKGHIAAKAFWMLRDYARRSTTVIKSRRYDAVVIHREAALIGPAIYERLIAHAGPPIIYDFDDAIWSPAQARVNGLFARLHFFGKTSSICKLAAAVTTGNDFLADYARKRNPNVFVVPTSVELRNYPMIKEPVGDGKFIVCWTGSTSTLVHFEHARPGLELLARRVPLEVKVICSRPPDRPIAGAETVFVPWSAETEAEDVGACHVGIMPMPDDEISRGKCAMKAIQFMAAGRPVVVSPVGVNRDLVRPGINGLWASSAEQWADALLQLANSPELRFKLGANARQTIETGYSAELSAARFAAAVRSVTGRSKGSAVRTENLADEIGGRYDKAIDRHAAHDLGRMEIGVSGDRIRPGPRASRAGELL
jgi:glycosyltransferase involved in cell wall biosynthesis